MPSHLTLTPLGYTKFGYATPIGVRRLGGSAINLTHSRLSGFAIGGRATKSPTVPQRGYKREVVYPPFGTLPMGRDKRVVLPSLGVAYYSAQK